MTSLSTDAVDPVHFERRSMEDSVIAVFDDHMAVDAAVKQLSAAGFAMTNLSVVGKGYHTEEKSSAFIMPATVSSYGVSVALYGAGSGVCSSATCSFPSRLSAM